MSSNLSSQAPTKNLSCFWFFYASLSAFSGARLNRSGENAFSRICCDSDLLWADLLWFGSIDHNSKKQHAKMFLLLFCMWKNNKRCTRQFFVKTREFLHHPFVIALNSKPKKTKAKWVFSFVLLRAPVQTPLNIDVFTRVQKYHQFAAISGPPSGTTNKSQGVNQQLLV
jgi:hypothetical protein